MQGSFGNPSSSGPSQESFSNSEGVAFSTGGTITRVPNGSSYFNIPFLQQGFSVPSSSSYPASSYSSVASTQQLTQQFPPYMGQQYGAPQSPYLDLHQHQPEQFPDFSNTYGFVGQNGALRQFPSSTSNYKNSNGNANYRNSNGSNGRGQSFGGKHNGGSWQSWSRSTETRSHIVQNVRFSLKEVILPLIAGKGQLILVLWDTLLNAKFVGRKGIVLQTAITEITLHIKVLLILLL